MNTYLKNNYPKRYKKHLTKNLKDFVLSAIITLLTCIRAMALTYPGTAPHPDASLINKIAIIKKRKSHLELEDVDRFMDVIGKRQSSFLEGGSLPYNNNADKEKITPYIRNDFISHIPRKKLSMVIIPVIFNDVNKLQKKLSKHNGLLSPSGKLIVDESTNKILVIDYKQNIAKIKSFIHMVDVAPQQVMIKARIIDIDNQSLRDLGVDFAMQQSGRAIDSSGYEMSIPQTNTELGTLQIPLLKLASGSNFDMRITALQHSGRVKLIATPELLTINRHSAIIQSGEDVPYQQSTNNGGTSIAFKKAGLALKVTPIILSKKRIKLQLEVDHDQVGETLSNGTPMIRTRKLQTQVIIHQGQTLVLGGIFRTTDNDRSSRVPFISSIPVLGWLFRHHIKSRDKQQLLIFVTPKII